MHDFGICEVKLFKIINLSFCILDPPSVLPDPITGFLEVKLREEVRMSCKADGVPYPIITWLYEVNHI